MYQEQEKNYNFSQGLLIQDSSRSIVLGMLWEPLDIETSTPDTCAARAQLKNGTHYIRYAPIEKNVQQLGIFGALQDGKSYYSGALLALKALGDSWLGIFSLGTYGYWLIGVYKEQVVPYTDVVFLNLIDAQSRFEELTELFDWKTFYSCEQSEMQSLLTFDQLKSQWNYEDAESLIALYESKNRNARRMRYLGLIIGVFGCLVSVCGLIYKWRELNRLKQAERMRLILQEQNLKDSWKKFVPAREFLDRAMQEILSCPLQNSGWKIISGSFDGKNFYAVYKQVPGGTKETLESEMKGSEYQISFSGGREGKATLKKTVSIKGNNSQQLPQIKTFYNQLQDLLERDLVAGKVNIVQTERDFLSSSFQLSSNISPDRIFVNPDLNGVCFTAIGFTITTAGKISWNFSGRLYGT